MTVSEIFENQIKIEPKVMSIESLFNNMDRIKNTNYKPSYQRNYVWDDEKATYFIESILLGTEVPPLIYFRNAKNVEIIDGRQRYETILRFVKNELKLKKNGLHKLNNINLANKSFLNIGDKLTEYFWDTKLRIIEFSFHTKNVDPENEEIVKKEIFKRYNSGITPLKPTEIDKAIYLEDDLNSYLRSQLQSDSVLNSDISNLFHFEKNSQEVILKKLRQLLVQHHVPIRYYAVKKDTIISKYYEHLFSKISTEDISLYYDSLITKVNLLKLVQKEMNTKELTYNRLISECLFWAFSIYETENANSEPPVLLGAIRKRYPNLVPDLVEYIGSNISAFTMERNSFFGVLITRYETIAKFFEEKFDLDFSIYIQTNKDFLQAQKALTPQDGEGTSFDELRINKPEPSSIAIVDIVRQMNKQRFLIRPPYQRDEVTNPKKSSSIIESILLGIKLPPIFVFKRKDQTSEVLDGQQRLLSILGFLKESYRDENNQLKHSKKNGYALNLKHSILPSLTGKKFDQLSAEDKEKIRNFDLWIIEISEKNNANFEPIDLFVRLNNKPYPIKEDTFEMWNSYISREIVDTIKSIHRNNSEWFYFRKNNARMEDENIIVALIYFEYDIGKNGVYGVYGSKDLDGYLVYTKMNFRVRSKNEISKVLESNDAKQDFLRACNKFEFGFIRKLKELVSNDDNISVFVLSKNLDYILGIENGRRTQVSFYALWCILYEIPFTTIQINKLAIREEVRTLCHLMNHTTSKVEFDNQLKKFRKKYKTPKPRTSFEGRLSEMTYANLEDVSIISNGKMIPTTNDRNVKEKVPYIKKLKAETFYLNPADHQLIDWPNDDDLKEQSLRDRILIRKTVENGGVVLNIARTPVVVGSGIISVTPTRQGFHIYYISSILASPLGLYLLHGKQKDKDELTVQSIKDIPIPLIEVSNQLPFITVTEYLLSLKENDERFLFFKRLCDLMVYEVFFQETFRETGVEFLKYLNDLPRIGDADDKDSIISKAYRQLSDPSHEVMASSLKVLNFDFLNSIASNDVNL